MYSPGDSSIRRQATQLDAIIRERWPGATDLLDVACGIGTQALGLKMVDALGGLEEAIDAAAKLAKLPTPPPVERPRRRFSIIDLVRNELGLTVPAVFLPTQLPMFKTPLYLMD